MMTSADDKEMFKMKVWGLILKGYVDHFEPPRKEKTWTDRVGELGIRIFRCGDPEPGFIAVDYDEGFMGGVHVPIEIAARIAALGYMP